MRRPAESARLRITAPRRDIESLRCEAVAFGVYPALGSTRRRPTSRPRAQRMRRTADSIERSEGELKSDEAGLLVASVVGGHKGDPGRGPDRRVVVGLYLRYDAEQRPVSRPVGKVRVVLPEDLPPLPRFSRGPDASEPGVLGVPQTPPRVRADLPALEVVGDLDRQRELGLAILVAHAIEGSEALD